MAKRQIIKIDEQKCTGCGVCIPNCPEGAIQIIDGKARLISDIFCDGLGACIGKCPEEAISTEEREAEPYDEKKTMRENIIKAGKNTIIAHLKHLKEHGETKFLKEALEVLKEKGIDIEFDNELTQSSASCNHSCPGSKTIDFSNEKENGEVDTIKRTSQLKQWPVQLTLVSPNASYFQEKDVLLVADCVAYSLADFHKDYLKEKSIAIACPKLDSNIDMYIDKLTVIIDDAKINTLTVITMEVPCCSGLLNIAKIALKKSKRKIPIKSLVVSIKGEIVKDEWL